MPLAKCDFAVVAAAHRTNGPAFLLSAVNPIRKAIVRGHVIELRGRLVIPSAPRLAVVHGNYRALITGKRNRLRVLAADPNALIVIAARCAAEADKRFPSIARFPSGGVRDEDHVRIVRRNCNAHRTGTAAADTAIAVGEAPGFSGVIRTVDTGSFFCLHRGVNTMRLTWRNRNANATETTIVRRRQTLG